ncbi:TldD/PmbA family protein [Methermicoccus shengliensis]|uniref:TldD/PmbA family protein n=1 Tax=Methermicoccus shengliensis TaxID=660064 RepID=A0A832VN45_9EURY|nr:TldD/PmbA family protein [Methermicoccus shengliensis]KUK04012.1 MAG: PmbA protein [Euryarchaeota archaeon 55_53]KUK29755.1 MAG: PmbA protein [Methanosarcinales archeaon 56_1174]MDI3488551.1 PmbA protein [Methanosarcinales archaeon]MDN5295872.1 PmbA protein [Methanosarcinales archaeon]HIH69946.1 TldD/PmbA family protein [Methermicoccus shengliensis]
MYHDELCSHLERAIENAKRVDEVELYASELSTLSVKLRRGELSEVKHSHTLGIGVRVVCDGRIGFSSTTDIRGLDECIERAGRLAVFGERLEHWEGFPAPQSVPRVSGLYDERVVSTDVEEACRLSLELARVPREKGALLSSGGLSLTSGAKLLFNSGGLRVCEPRTLCYAHGEVVAREGGRTASAYDFELSRTADLPMGQMAKRMSEIALAGLHPTGVEKVRGTLVLRPPAVADVLENALMPSLSLDSVLKGRSALAERVGEKVASSELSLVDDGLLHGGVESSCVDDEGTPSNTKPVIERGVLKTFLSDVYTACKAGEKSTGNCVRGSYSTPPATDTRNLIVSVPHMRAADIDEGVVLTNLIGAHTANPITGELSVEGRGAFLIEGGHMGMAIDSTMLSVNVFELLERLRGGLGDVRRMGEIITPSLVFEDVELVGTH